MGATAALWISMALFLDTMPPGRKITEIDR
jgi:hypothetical protein